MVYGCTQRDLREHISPSARQSGQGLKRIMGSQEKSNLKSIQSKLEVDQS